MNNKLGVTVVTIGVSVNRESKMSERKKIAGVEKKPN